MLKSLKVVSSIAVLISLAACSNNSQKSEGGAQSASGQNIVGGTDVEAKDIVASSTIGLVFQVRGPQGSGEAICTGTLVAENVILTAAHCLVGAVRGYAVFTADITKATEAEARPIILADVHPNYRHTARYNRADVALVKFKGDLPAGYKVAELGGAELVKDGAKVILAGYGASSMTEGQSDGSAVLRKTAVLLTKSDISDFEMFFDQHEGSGACHGDSGGPAYVKKGKKLYLIGITSTSATLEGGATCLEGSLYEKVPVFADYITETVTKLQNTPEEEAAN